MITYQNILNDNLIIEEYKKIDKINNFYMSHGLKHINNIINNCKKLADIIKLSEQDKNNLLIAVTLHDIGLSTDRANQANKSTNFAKSYLKNKLSNEDIEFIYNIIDRHSWKIPKDNSLEVICCFADKIDFSKNRLEDNYQEKYNFKSILEHITDIIFEIKNNTFIFKVITDNNLTIEKLFKEKKRYDEGIIFNVSTLANWLNMNYEVCFSNKLLKSSH